MNVDPPSRAQTPGVNFGPLQTPAPPPAWMTFFASLGPVGSIITSLVVAIASYLSGLLTGWLQQKGFVSVADVPTVSGIIISAAGAVAVMIYKAITNRIGAKITEVAKQPGITVVAPVEVATSPEHAADTSVISPRTAAAQFGLGQPAASARS